MLLRLSRSRPWLAPLALIVGAFAMLFDGVKLLFSNWRLTLVQVLPAMWIWVAMLDLKAHVLHGKAFHELKGPAVVIPLVLVVAAITQPGRPQIRPALTQARSHLGIILISGGTVGILLGVSTLVVDRWGLFWFAVSLSIVVGIMMVCYVAVPSRLIGFKPKPSRRDKLAATAVGGAVGAVICAPPYALGRIGLLMLDSHVLFIPGVILFAIGLTLQAGATGAVKTIKMSAKLVGSQRDEVAVGASQQDPP